MALRLGPWAPPERGLAASIAEVAGEVTGKVHRGEFAANSPRHCIGGTAA
jgi:hypothetical protein